MGIRIFDLFGSSIAVHTDLVKYIDTIHKYKEKSNAAISRLNILDKKGCDPEEICAAIWECVCTDVQEILIELSQYGVYNKTVSDFISKTCFDATLSAYHDHLSHDISEAEDMRDNSLTIAETATDAMVTGLPFEIFTNSIIGMGVYATQQASELKKQRAKANEEYYRRAANINRTYNSTVSQAKARQREAFYNEMVLSISKAYGSLASKYLEELSSCNAFDLRCVEGFSSAKSSELLNNLDIMPAKSEVIKHSILACPFNPDSFARAGLLGLFEPGLHQLASFLHIQNDIIERIETLSGLSSSAETKPTKIYSVFGSACRAIAFFSGESEQAVLNRYFPNLRNEIIAAFHKLTVELKLGAFTADGLWNTNQETVNLNAVKQFVINHTCSKADIETLRSQFGIIGVEDEIARVTGYSGYDAMSHEAIQNYLINWISDVLQQQRKDEAIRQAQAEAKAKAEAARRKKKQKRNIAIISAAAFVCLVLTIVGIFVLKPMLRYNEALSLYTQKEYDQAKEILHQLGSYKDSKELIAGIPYQKAEDLAQAGRYEDGIKAFEQIAGYNDSADRALQLSYQYAEILKAEGNYSLSLDWFRSISPYSDSDARVQELEALLFDEGYNAFEQGDYKNAAALFKTLPDTFNGNGVSVVELLEMCSTASDYILLIDTLESPGRTVKIYGFDFLTEAINGYNMLFERGKEITGVSLSAEKEKMVEMYNLYSKYDGIYFNEGYALGRIEAELYFSTEKDGYFFLRLSHDYTSSGKAYTVAELSGGVLESEDGSYQMHNGTTVIYNGENETWHYTRDDYWAIEKSE